MLAQALNSTRPVAAVHVILNEHMPNEIHPKHRTPWVTIMLVLLAVFSFFALSDGGQTVIRMTGGGGGFVPEPPMMREQNAVVSTSADVQSGMGVSASMPMMDSANYPYRQYGYGTPAATDTREFNKMYYSAEMRTRNVQQLVRRAETTIRGFGGRVDQTSSAEKYGSVSFVIPASKYDEFRNEIETFVNPRFLKVDISSQNMLPQKQSIEQTQEQVQKNLDELTANRKKAVSDHSATVRSLQGQIDANASELATLQAQAARPDLTSEARVQNTARQNQLQSDQQSLKSRLANENSNYSATIASFDSQIKYANDNLAGVKKQDKALLDDVATVNGTISFRWISLFEIVHEYLPGYWIPGLIALAAAIAYFFERRRMVPLV